MAEKLANIRGTDPKQEAQKAFDEIEKTSTTFSGQWMPAELYQVKRFLDSKANQHPVAPDLQNPKVQQKISMIMGQFQEKIIEDMMQLPGAEPEVIKNYAMQKVAKAFEGVETEKEAKKVLENYFGRQSKN